MTDPDQVEVIMEKFNMTREESINCLLNEGNFVDAVVKCHTHEKNPNAHKELLMVKFTWNDKVENDIGSDGESDFDDVEEENICKKCERMYVVTDYSDERELCLSCHE